MSDQNGAFKLGQQRDMSALEQLRTNYRPSEVASIFKSDPIIAQYQKICIFVCGGAADVLGPIAEMLDLYPELRSLFEIFHVDFQMDPRRKRPEITGLHLGKIVNGTVRDILADNGGTLPEGLFTKEETPHIMRFVKEWSNHHFGEGAGAEHLLGRLGFHYCAPKVKRYLAQFFTKLRDGGMFSILPIVIAGSSGGAGWGMLEQFYTLVHTLSKSAGLTSGTGAVKAIMNFHAYDSYLYDSKGQPTGTADDLWQRSQVAWESRVGDYYISTPTGADGFLLIVKAIAESLKVINNSTKRGYTPAIIQVRQLTKANKCRMATEYIRRGISSNDNYWVLTPQRGLPMLRKKYEVDLRVPSLATVQDYARAAYILDRARALQKLAITLASHNPPLSQNDIANYDDVEALIARARSIVNTAETQLHDASGMNGSFLRESDKLVERHILDSRVADIVDGRDKVVLPRGNAIASMFLKQVEWDYAHPLGEADILLEIGKLGSPMRELSYESKTRRDEEEEEIEALVRQADEMANRLKGIF